MTLACMIYDQPGGQLLDDWTNRAQGAILRTNKNGFQSASWKVPLHFREAARWYNRSNLHIEWTDRAGRRVWEGRGEEPSISAAGLGMTAYGYWSCLNDWLHTGFWSAYQSSLWKIADQTFSSNYNPNVFSFNQDSEDLYVALKRGETINGSNRAAFYLEAPDAATNKVQAVQIYYDAYLPAGAKIQISSYSRDAAGNVVSITSHFTDSFSFTDGRSNNSKIQAFASGTSVLLEVYADSSVTPAVDTGVYYVRFRKVRAWGTGSLYCYADQVAAHLVQNTPGLSSNTALIQSPQLDLYNQIFQDMSPAAIINKLASIGDAQKRIWEAAVWAGRMLEFQPQGSKGKVWHVELAGDLSAQRSLRDVLTDAYSAYQDASGRTRRTPTSTDLVSQARHRVRRVGMVRAQTTDTSSTGQAYTQRDAYLADNKETRPRAELPILRVRDPWGNLYPKHMVRANDTIVIPELSPLLGDSFSKLRRLRVTETEYHVDNDQLAVRPELPPLTLDTLLMRQAEGGDRGY